MDKGKYIKEGGLHCPYCGSIYIEGTDFDMERGVLTQDIFCVTCEKVWIDKYFLVDILEVEDESQD